MQNLWPSNRQTWGREVMGALGWTTQVMCVVKVRWCCSHFLPSELSLQRAILADVGLNPHTSTRPCHDIHIDVSRGDISLPRHKRSLSNPFKKSLQLKCTKGCRLFLKYDLSLSLIMKQPYMDLQRKAICPKKKLNQYTTVPYG